MGSGKEAKEFLDRSIHLIKEISQKIQQEANKTWKVSNLKFELLGLKRKRGEKVKKLGEETLGLIRQSSIQTPSLDRFLKEIDEIEKEMQAKEVEIERSEHEHERRISEERAPISFSGEKKVKEGSKTSSVSASSDGRKANEVLTEGEDEGLE